MQRQDMILITAGDAWIGSDEVGESPIVSLNIPEFYIGKYAVSNEEYARFIKDNGYTRAEFWTDEGWQWLKELPVEEHRPFFWDFEAFNQANQPVTGVSFYEATAFSKWAGGRLPTEIEWEKAARGTDKRAYPWGDKEPDLDLANYAPDFVPHNRSAVSVFDFPKNESPFGCRQMAGNVFEWCSDYFHFDTPEHRSDDNFSEETRPSERHILKGGAWTVGLLRLRGAARWSYTPNLRDNIIGFRVVFDSIEGQA